MSDFDEKNNITPENTTVGDGFVMSDVPETDNTPDPQPQAAPPQPEPEKTNFTGGADNSHYPYGADNSRYPYGADNSQYPYGARNGYGAPGQDSRQNANPYSYRDNGYGGQNSSANQGNTYNSNPYNYSNTGAPYAYTNGPESPKKKSKKGLTVFIVLLVLLLVCASVGVGMGIAGDSETSKEATGTPIENVGEFTSNSTPDVEATSGVNGALAPKDIFTKVQQSSVGILCYSNNQLASEGSGVIFMEDSDGKYTYIITCAHVISDRGISVMIQLYNEKEYEAQVIGYDTRTDIGVLRIEASGLQVADFGDSEKLNVGDSVFAIGNPGGTEFANSFTGGMISAIDRPVSSSSTGYTMECIQHTAAINPGNSGGALLNELGQVIGINSMKIVDDEYEGMGFAVPSSVFIKIVNEIIANGYVTNRPKLGVTYYAATDMQAYAMFVAIKGLPSGSIVINSIATDSSLADTQAKKGDMIIAANGKDFENSSDLAELIENSNVGDAITLTLVRINNDYTFEQFDVEITLVEDKGDTSITEEESSTSVFEYFYGSGSDGYNPFG